MLSTFLLNCRVCKQNEIQSLYNFEKEEEQNLRKLNLVNKFCAFTL